MSTDVKTFTRSDEERDLDTRFGAELCHRSELGFAQKHRTRALRNAIDGHPLVAGAANHLFEDLRTFDAGDLDPECGSVRKAQPCRSWATIGGNV